jgi:hypothetical protein
MHTDTAAVMQAHPIIVGQGRGARAPIGGGEQTNGITATTPSPTRGLQFHVALPRLHFTSHHTILVPFISQAQLKHEEAEEINLQEEYATLKVGEWVSGARLDWNEPDVRMYVGGS